MEVSLPDLGRCLELAADHCALTPALGGQAARAPAERPRQVSPAVLETARGPAVP